MGRIRRNLRLWLFLLLLAALLFAPVLAGLALGILPRSPRRWVRQSLAFAIGRWLPRGSVEAGLLQPRRERW